MHLRIASHVWVLPLFLITFFFPINILAQPIDRPPAVATPLETQTGTINNQQLDKENVEKFQKMSPEKVSELNKKLEEAVKLYDQRKFGQALPIFKEIADQVETSSVLWWLGTSAMSVGEHNLAVEKFKKMLVIDPNLHRVRLELAVAYFELARYEEAKTELEIVKASTPPESVQKNIDSLLAAIEEKTKRVSWNVRFSQGMMWDDNINGGPSNRDLAVIGGTLSLNNDSTKTNDWASVTSISGNVLYDIKNYGLMWNSTADLYYKNYLSHSQFSYGALDVTTGPWWTGRQDILKVPIGYTEKNYGHERLSYVYHVDPNYEHFFGQYFSLKGQFSYAKENYYSENNSDLNNISKSYEIAPSFYFFDRQHIIILLAGYTFSDAETKRFTYTAPYYGVSYFTRFPTKTEFFARYQRTEKSYKDAPLLYSDDRIDRQDSFTAVLSQEFLKYFFASFVFTYVKNQSNADLYTYDQTTYMLNVGIKF
jgi:tetratricopeptide (TPR) repeat protein